MLSYYPTTTFVTVCVPLDDTLAQTVQKYIDIGSVEEWMKDLKTIWYMYIVIGFLAFGISITFMYLLRCCAGFITWSMIIGYFLLLIILGGLCIYKANNDLTGVPKDL